jgi:hypothetical protein
MNIPAALEQIGESLISALEYKRYPVEELDKSLEFIEEMSKNPDLISECEKHFKSEESSYVLFYISNTLYNLKTKSQITLNPETMKWLTSVWKNFLIRDKKYQEKFGVIDQYRKEFEEFFPAGSVFVNQIENVQFIKERYIKVNNSQELIKGLEHFHHSMSELKSWMKPTYFFMLDYYYERRLKTGQDNINAVLLEREGLWGFGETGYSYGEISVMNTQALAFLEGVYLILKKTDTGKKIIILDGKQKFLSVPEIYNRYVESLAAAKKEIVSIKSN